MYWRQKTNNKKIINWLCSVADEEVIVVTALGRAWNSIWESQVQLKRILRGMLAMQPGYFLFNIHHKINTNMKKSHGAYIRNW